MNNDPNGHTVTSGYARFDAYQCDVPPSSPPRHDEHDPFGAALALAKTCTPYESSVFMGMVGQDVGPGPGTPHNAYRQQDTS